MSIVSWLLDGDPERGFELTRESNALTRDCMIESGFSDYPVSVPPLGPPPPLTRPLPALTVEQAQADGYEPTSLHEPSVDWVDPVVDYFGRLTAAEATAFQVAISECAVQVREVLFGNGFDEYEESRQRLESEMISLFDQFYAASEVRDVFERWSTCMDRTGFEFDTPFDAMDAAMPREETFELQVAGSDARCRLELATEEDIARLFRAAEANFLADNEALVMEVMDLSGRTVPSPSR
ncbi:hypothetical protein BH10ACT3_BH10ACT3_15900 [soil metagenome]